jgi:hypothetical protein
LITVLLIDICEAMQDKCLLFTVLLLDICELPE